MGMMRAAGIIISIILILIAVSLALSFDMYSAVYIGAIGISIFGFVVGFVGAIKLYSHIERYKENNDKKAVESLVKDIKRAHESIIIVGGTANPAVYNSDNVANSFKKAVQKGVKIQTVFSDIDLKKENTIIDLAEKGMIELYIPNRDKVPKNHFRVVDGKYVYSEKNHTVEDTKRYYERFDNIYDITNRFEEAFDNIINNSEKLFVNNSLSGR